MPAMIKQNCTSCDVCVPACPTKSIIPGFTHHAIDTDSCEECAQCVPICPVGAIVLKKRTDFPEEQ